MTFNFPEFAENPEPRCPVVLLLDTSGSMAGAPIQSLNEGLQTFRQDVLRNEIAALRVEVAIVSFGPVQLVQDFITFDNFNPPNLEAEGLTPMGEAINYAVDLLESRKQIYRDNGVQYYRPWVFLITDGEPDPNSPWQTAATRARQAEADHKLLFFAVAVGDANTDILRQIAPPERPPLHLNGLDFKSMFLWLSSSMQRVSSSKVGSSMLSLPPVGWGQITT
jgi:uncharacterized protein YegL